MNLALNSRQTRLREQYREFAAGEILPQAAQWDRRAEFPLDIYHRAHELGYVNRFVPSQYGGQGYSLMDGCVANEELGFGCTGISTGLTINDLGLMPLLMGGTEEQKKRWLPQILAERRIVSFCVTEPDTGSDVAGLRTTARRVGDRYVIHGRKRWITLGPCADYFVVFAVTEPERGHQGLSCFLVPGDHPQVSRGPALGKMGQKAAPACEVVFEECDIPASHRLGQPGDGFLIIMKTFDASRATLSAHAVGLARRALTEARDYAGSRTAFGQSISRFQGVGFLLADMDIRVEAARRLVYLAAWRGDQGLRNTREAAMCKAFAGDAAMLNATEAVQVLGGNGYSEDFPVEKLMRDAKIFQIYEGTTQIQKQILVRELYR